MSSFPLDRPMRIGILWGIGAMLFFVLMYAAFFLQEIHNGQQMRDCVATGNHSWVQKHGEYYECVPDSEVSR